MASPYERADSKKGGFGGLLRRGSITLEGIEDLLAQAACVRDVTPAMLSSLCEERAVDLPNRLVRGRKRLYRRYLKYCFEDRVLSEDEQADLAHLRSLLHLSAADLAEIQDEVAIEVYGEAVDEVLEDFRLDDDEAQFLRALRDDLGLTDERAERIFRDGSSLARTRALSRARSSDRQFTEYHAAAGEFTGRSDETVEGAIEDALASAVVAIPKLHWFEVIQISGYASDGKTAGWHVTLRAGIRKE